MARIKLVYIGGGSTRAAGTMASLIARGQGFSGSEVVLVDLNAERLELIRTLAQRMARAWGVDLTVRATLDRRAALEDADAVLSSFRPGGFEARHLDESIPLRYGIIGQETQGPGGFFMALRSIPVTQAIVAEMEQVCPRAWLFNYTNPVNVVAEAVTHHSPIRMVSLCEGPIIFPRILARAAGLDPEGIDATMIGINHNCWSIRHEYRGEDLIPYLQEAYAKRRQDPEADVMDLRLLQLAAAMEAVPSYYFRYYYFQREILKELQEKPTTRAQDILAQVPGYWQHYREQAEQERPELDPARSRGGIHELELAFDVMDALFNDKKEVWPVNIPNRGAIPDVPADRVVELPGYVDRHGIVPLQQPPLPPHLGGLVKALAEHQHLAAEAAWSGNRRQAIRALAAHPWVTSLDTAESLYDTMAAALQEYLPERLLR